MLLASPRHLTGQASCVVTCLLPAQEGLVALWRGWVPSVIGVVPYVGLNFAVYESLKDVVIQASGAGRFSAPCSSSYMPYCLATLACAAAAAAAAAAAMLAHGHTARHVWVATRCTS